MRQTKKQILRLARWGPVEMNKGQSRCLFWSPSVPEVPAHDCSFPPRPPKCKASRTPRPVLGLLSLLLSLKGIARLTQASESCSTT